MKPRECAPLRHDMQEDDDEAKYMVCVMMVMWMMMDTSISSLCYDSNGRVRLYATMQQDDC